MITKLNRQTRKPFEDLTDPMKITLFFTLNPERVLFGQDIKRALGFTDKNISRRLAVMIRLGYISRHVSLADHKQVYYEAGPKLLELIARKGALS